MIPVAVGRDGGAARPRRIRFERAIPAATFLDRAAEK
jgi:hypothetical protein